MKNVNSVPRRTKRLPLRYIKLKKFMRAVWVAEVMNDFDILFIAVNPELKKSSDFHLSFKALTFKTSNRKYLFSTKKKITTDPKI